MKPFFLLGLTISLLIGKSLIGQTHEANKISAIQSINILPFSINDETNDTLVYVFRNDTVLLRTNHFIRSLFFNADSEEPEKVSKEISYRYFLFKKGEPTGKWFEANKVLADNGHNTTLVDSVLSNHQGYFSISLSELINQDSISLVSNRTIGQQIEKTYIFNKNKNVNGPDTLILRFSPTFKHPDFLFYNYKPVEENQALYNVEMTVHIDVPKEMALQMPALIKLNHYLTEVPPAVIVEAEKYFALFKQSGITDSKNK